MFEHVYIQYTCIRNLIKNENLKLIYSVSIKYLNILLIACHLVFLNGY